MYLLQLRNDYLKMATSNSRGNRKRSNSESSRQLTVYVAQIESTIWKHRAALDNVLQLINTAKLNLKAAHSPLNQVVLLSQPKNCACCSYNVVILSRNNILMMYCRKTCNCQEMCRWALSIVAIGEWRPCVLRSYWTAVLISV